MRRHPVVALAVFALSRSAYGADLPVKAFDAPATYDWTGYYAGAQLDYQAGQSRWSESQFGAIGTQACSTSERDMISRPERAVTQ